jgi:hypothetical protein
MSPPTSGLKNKPRKKSSMKQVASRAFNGPVGKTKHFIITAVRTSDPIHNLFSARMMILEVIKLK